MNRRARQRAPWWAYPDREYRPFDFSDQFSIHPLVPDPGKVITPEEKRAHQIDSVNTFLTTLWEARHCFVQEFGTDHRYVEWVDEEIAEVVRWLRERRGPGSGE